MLESELKALPVCSPWMCCAEKSDPHLGVTSSCDQAEFAESVVG